MQKTSKKSSHIYEVFCAQNWVIWGAAESVIFSICSLFCDKIRGRRQGPTSGGGGMGSFDRLRAGFRQSGKADSRNPINLFDKPILQD